MVTLISGHKDFGIETWGPMTRVEANELEKLMVATGEGYHIISIENAISGGSKPTQTMEDFIEMRI